MNFSYTILYVENVVTTLDFYEKAFGFSRKYIHEAGDYGELDTGGTVLAFATREMMTDKTLSPCAPSPMSPSFELAFATEDVDRAVQIAVEFGAQLIKKPEVKPWGQTVAYVSDNNGFLIEICTPV